jgi:hypothetical protein
MESSLTALLRRAVMFEITVLVTSFVIASTIESSTVVVIFQNGN